VRITWWRTSKLDFKYTIKQYICFICYLNHNSMICRHVFIDELVSWVIELVCINWGIGIVPRFDLKQSEINHLVTSSCWWVNSLVSLNMWNYPM